MATTRKAGRNGQIYLSLTDSGNAVPVASLNSWSIDFSVDRIDVTCFGDTNSVKVSSLPNVSGSFAGVFDTVGQKILSGAQDGLTRKMYLYPAAVTEYFYGDILIDASYEGSVSKEVSISSKFDAAGPIGVVGIS